MKRFFSSIYGRFLIIFFGLLLIPILLTLTLFLTFQFNTLTTQVETMLIDRATSMQQASDTYTLGADDVIALFDDQTLTITTDRYDRASWSIAERTRLERGETISETERLPQIAFLLGETVVTLTPDAEDNPISIFRDISLQTLLLTALVSSGLILLAVRLMTRRIDRVTAAVNRVASGDLSVRIHDAASDEVGKLARQFNQMTETLATNEAKNEELTSIMAHEFKTPVASILGYATMLKRGGLDEVKQKTYVEQIEREGKRLSRLSRDLLRLAKLDHTIVGLDASRLSVSEQVREAILSLESTMTHKRLRLDVTMEEITMVGDASLLHQVWVNLIQNATTYAYEGSVLSIRLTEQDDEIRFEVQDEGEGMTEAQRTRAFERFYQADSSRNREGSGLGLAIVRQIVELHDGAVTLTSELKKGTTARVVLPVKDR